MTLTELHERWLDQALRHALERAAARYSAAGDDLAEIPTLLGAWCAAAARAIEDPADPGRRPPLEAVPPLTASEWIALTATIATVAAATSPAAVARWLTTTARTLNP